MRRPTGQFVILVGIFLGMGLGVAAGFWMGAEARSFAWMGEFFLRALKMLIVPLVVASMIVGVTSLGDVRRLGRAGALTLLYYATTTAIAVVIGLFLVNLIGPGQGVPPPQSAHPAAPAAALGLTDLILSMVPENLVRAAADMDVLPLILVSLLFGGVLSTLGEKGRVVVRFFEGVNEAVMRIMHLVMWLAPVGVFGLVAGKLGDVGGGPAFLAEVAKVGMYILTVLLGLAIHGIVVLPLILALAARRNPFRYLRALLPALTTAFSTGSSAATLPVTFGCVEETAGVSRASADLVLPLGATVNMDGTALYEAVAAVFIAQSYGIPLGFHAQVLIFLTATLAAVGAASVPQAGLVTMVMVLQAVHLPLEGIGAILAVDWFLDRWRTAVNVWGDATGAAVVERMLGLSERGEGS